MLGNVRFRTELLIIGICCLPLALIVVLLALQVRLGRFGFFIFGSIRFGFQARVPGFGFFGFGFKHQSEMKAHGKSSKGSEAVYAFTPPTSHIDDQQLDLLLTCITGCKPSGQYVT